jgi:hypothetical protein
MPRCSPEGPSPARVLGEKTKGIGAGRGGAEPEGDAGKSCARERGSGMTFLGEILGIYMNAEIVG